MSVSVGVEMISDVGVKVQRLQPRKGFNGSPEVVFMVHLSLEVRYVFIDADLAFWSIALAKVEQSPWYVACSR